MARVVYSPLAESDLREIVEYIARDTPAAARRWLAQIREKCQLLASHPQVGQQRDDLECEGCRSFSVGSYVIFFRANEDGVEIARVVRGERDVRRLWTTS